MPVVAEGEPIFDVALVEGSVPENTEIEFELWRQHAGDIENDELVATTERQDVPTIGEYTSPEVEDVPAGKYYWRERLIRDGDIEYHYGEPRLPNETTRVAKVTTDSVLIVAEGEEVYDLAIVEGAPPEGSGLIFELWRWNDGGVEDDELVATTERIDVDGAGEYLSPFVADVEAGKYYWREILVDAPTDPEDPDSDRPTIHYGDPRLPNETTHVVRVTTQAVEEIVQGEQAHDVAFVEGSVPEDSGLTFELWKRGNSGVETDVLVDTTEMIVIDEAGEHVSPAVTINEVGTYYWREILLTPPGEDGERETVHYGQPRLPNETTIVTARQDGGLALTGANLALVAFVALGLAGGGAAMIVRRGKKGGA